MYYSAPQPHAVRPTSYYAAPAYRAPVVAPTYDYAPRPADPVVASTQSSALALDTADGVIDGKFHGSRVCPKMHYPVPEFPSPAGGDLVQRIPRALGALGVGLYNPIEYPTAAHVQLQSPPGNVVTLRNPAESQGQMSPQGAVPDTVAGAPRVV